MKILILISMLVIFISVIFILFIANDISERHMECSQNEANKTICNIKEFGSSFVFGLIMMGMFVLIDILVIRFLLDALTHN